MIYVGIDPGKTGACAVIWPNSIGGKTVEVYDWSTSVAAYLPHNRIDTIVVIEKVHAMPRQGVTSMFNFGLSVGWWHGTLNTLGYDKINHITPQQWKKHYGLIKKDKEVSRLMAISFFPELKGKLLLKKHHNRAEALLLAHYAMTAIGKEMP